MKPRIPQLTEFLPSAWLIDSLLSPEECEELIQVAKTHGIEDMSMSGDLRHRQRVTARMELPHVAERIWGRIRDLIPQEIVVASAAEAPPGVLYPSSCIGTWKPSMIGTRVNVALCTGKGHLAAHRDADHVLNEHERTFLTINGFLTDRKANTGGATRFLVDNIPVEGADIRIRPSDILARIEPAVGRSVVFMHGLMHDGEPIVENSEPKWIFRLLVYYKRDPATAPVQTEEQQEAAKLLKLAEAAEEDGQISEAIKLYSRAYRLDPSLEEVAI
jgi:hypothetical protein